MARPPLFKDEKVRKKLIGAAAAGMSNADCCRAAGISDETLRQWELKAAEGRTPFKQFIEELDVARANGELSNILEIKRDSSWQAKAWLLERMYPHKYGRRQIIDNRLSTPEGPVKVEQSPERFNLEVLSEEEQETFLRLIRKVRVDGAILPEGDDAGE